MTRERVLELWWLANENRHLLAEGVEVAATIENIFARHPIDPPDTTVSTPDRKD